MNNNHQIDILPGCPSPTDSEVKINVSSSSVLQLTTSIKGCRFCGLEVVEGMSVVFKCQDKLELL